MFTFETGDPNEVRRFRIAQFNGRTATFRSNGSTVTGMVRSIVENTTMTPPVWVVTLVPKPLRADRQRPTPRLRAFAEDRY